MPSVVAAGRGFGWYAFGVAIGALHEVDVVRAFEVLEGGVHGFDVAAAVGEAWVAGGAGGSSLLAVLLVAGEAA